MEEKHAWPTLTGRQQFYLDHPWFFEADEVLPRFKPLPRPGGEHPILLMAGHNRWSIHAIWRAHPNLLRMQRGGPVMWISVEDAAARGIQDGAQMRVWNDHGSFQIGAKVSPAMPPGEAIVYHAWEPYQFPGWRGNMEVVSSPYKPLHFAGGYGHLRYRIFFGGPVHVPARHPDRDRARRGISGSPGRRPSARGFGVDALGVGREALDGFLRGRRCCNASTSEGPETQLGGSSGAARVLWAPAGVFGADRQRNHIARVSLTRPCIHREEIRFKSLGKEGERALFFREALPGEATPGQQVAPAQLLDQDGFLALDGAGVDLAGGAELVRWADGTRRSGASGSSWPASSLPERERLPAAAPRGGAAAPSGRGSRRERCSRSRGPARRIGPGSARASQASLRSGSGATGLQIRDQAMKGSAAAVESALTPLTLARFPSRAGFRRACPERRSPARSG